MAMRTIYKSYRWGCEGYYRDQIPITSSDTLEGCIKETEEYLGWPLDYFVAKTEIVYRHGMALENG